MKQRLGAILGLVVIALIIYLWMAGSAVVIDETGDVVSVVITNDRDQQPLLRIGKGRFYAIPHLEGTIEVHCRSGSRTRWGYVTGNMHTKIRVTEHDCRKAVHA
jgi:hypothetical protein